MITYSHFWVMALHWSLTAAVSLRMRCCKLPLPAWIEKKPSSSLYLFFPRFVRSIQREITENTGDAGDQLSSV